MSEFNSSKVPQLKNPHRLVKLDAQFLADFFTQRDTPITLVVEQGLPPGCVVENLLTLHTHNEPWESYNLVVSHPSFSPVAEGQLIPTIYVKMSVIPTPIPTNNQ